MKPVGNFHETVGVRYIKPMAKKVILTIILIPVSALIISTLICAIWSRTTVSKEEYVVYSAFIEQRMATAVPSHSQLLFPTLFVKQEPMQNRFVPLLLLLAPFGPRSDRAPSLTWSAQFSRIAKSWVGVNYKNHFQLPLPYELVGQDDSALAGPDFEAYLELSRVGFDFGGHIAVFHYGFICGLCGDGGYVVMVKVNNGWRIAHDVSQWSS